jgi:hypothetical protein
MKEFPMLTYEQLREYLNYDPETGEFTWIKPRNYKKPGEAAGYVSRTKGVYIWFAGKGYRAHRVAWLWMTGSWPKHQIDHIDRNQNNNIWANLRDATPAQNSQNTSRSVRSVSGVKGVVWDKSCKRWKAHITCNKVVHVIGYYDDLDMAASEVAAARVRFHGSFACHL